MHENNQPRPEEADLEGTQLAQSIERAIKLLKEKDPTGGAHVHFQYRDAYVSCRITLHPEAIDAQN